MNLHAPRKALPASSIRKDGVSPSASGPAANVWTTGTTLPGQVLRRFRPVFYGGGTGSITLRRSDYRSVEEMAGQLFHLLKALSEDVNYSVKIQVVKGCDL